MKRSLLSIVALATLIACGEPPDSPDGGPASDAGPGATMCHDMLCNGHGVCSETPAGPTCVCDTGWTGARCDRCDAARGYVDDGAGGCRPEDPCAGDPCTAPNRGVCVDDGGAARCDCDPGFMEDGAGSCVPGGDPCMPNPCSVLGQTVCVDDAGAARCDCDPGWREDGMGGCTDDPCAPNPCMDPNQGVCVDDAGTARCDCDPGFHPDGVGGCTDDPCVPDPCGAMGMACRDDGTGNPECFTPVCDDMNPCTDDQLVGSVCTFDPLPDATPCSTTLCTTGQVCTAGTCGGGTAVDCDDANPCTDDTCDRFAGCQRVPDDTNVPDDGFACTTDSCSAGVASNVPDDAMCDDGLWCSGVESCAPGAGSDARGCVTSMVPTAPPDPGPCASYGACDEATMSFPRIDSPVGASCDDGIACTSTDRCRSGGRCAGTPIAGCGGTCSAPTSLGSSVDLPTATVSGAVTLDGAAPPSSRFGWTPLVYLKSRDTGAEHLINNTSTDVIDARLLPGIYDIVYRRNHDRSDNDVGRADAASDPWPRAYAVLASEVVIGAGPNPLTVDLPTATVSGAVTLDGAAPPSSRFGWTPLVYLKSRDTGAEHLINNTSTDVIDARLLPGTYDIVYRRNHDRSDNDVGRADAAGDPWPRAYQHLGAVTLTAGANAVNVDLPTATVSGAVTLDGAAPPSSRFGWTPLVYLKSRDTGAEHLINNTSTDVIDARLLPGTYDIVYRRNHDRSDNDVGRADAAGDPWPRAYQHLGAVTLTAGANAVNVDLPTATVSGAVTLDGAAPPSSRFGWTPLVYLKSRDTGAEHLINNTSTDVIDARLLPGTYDIVYRRNHDRSDNDVGRADAAGDPWPRAYQHLGAVTLTAGANAVNVDLPTATVSGAVTLDGAAPPSSRFGWTPLVYLKSRDTGAEHLINNTSTDVIDARLLPGTYDIVFRRNHDRSDNDVGRANAASDPWPRAYQHLGAVTLTAGANAVNVDLPTATVSGAVTLDGAAPPSSRFGWTPLVYLKSRDTGAEHLINNTSTDVIDARLLPGTYDIVFRRNHDRSDNDVGRANAASDPWPRAYEVLQYCVSP